MSLVLTPWTVPTTAERVRAVLKALGRTQAQLANVLGVSIVTVNRWCCGRSIPDRRSQVALEKLEDAYVGKPTEG